MADSLFDEQEFTTRFNDRTLSRIVALLKYHKLWAFGFIVLIAIVSVQDSLFTFFTRLIIDQGILLADRQRLVQLLSLYGGIAITQAAAVFGFIYLAGILGERVQYDLRKTMFDHLQQLSFAYFDRTPVGRIMSRVTSDSHKIAELVTWGMVDVTWGVMNILSALVFMMLINWRLALLVLLVIPVMILVAVKFQKKILAEYRRVRKLNSRLTGSYNEMITGVRVIKALRREEENLEEFSGETLGMYQASYRAAWYSAFFLPSIQIIGSIALGTIVWYGGLEQVDGGMTIGGIQAFIFYVAFMLWPIQDLARVWASMQSAMASAERIFALVDAVPEVQDRKDAYDPGTIRKRIVFEKVDFQYESGKPVLEDFSLDIEPGQRLALVGPTGGGKSTIINLICRFYEPTAGRINFDGVDYLRFTQKAIQSRIGIVLQTPYLFSGTIAENIHFGRTAVGRTDVFQAARLARAHEFIVNFEKGYDEQIGEGGSLLSFGQKQLICLARAVLAGPDIFIMDEATSSVDALSESLIQEGLEAVMEGRTSIVIAHRLSTIRRADRILVIENGRIVEQGDHETLMALKGRYNSLYTQQSRVALSRTLD